MKKIFQYLTPLVFLFFIAQYFIQYKEELSVLLSVKGFHVINLCAVSIFAHALYAQYLLFILEKLGLKEIHPWKWFKIIIISRFINFYVAQGANVYRSIKLKQEYGFSYAKSVSLTTFFSWYQTLVSLVMCSAFLIIFKPDLTIKHISVFYVLVTFTAVFFITPFLFKGWKLSNVSNPRMQWVSQRINEFLHHFFEFSKDSTLLIKITFINIIYFLLYLLTIYICFRAIDIRVSVEELSLFTILIILTKLFAIIPGNLGLTELLSGVLTESLGKTRGTGFIVSSLIRIIDFSVIVVLGMILSKFSFPKFTASKTQNDAV